jgi:hypothetical protein
MGYGTASEVGPGRESLKMEHAITIISLNTKALDGAIQPCLEMDHEVAK